MAEPRKRCPKCGINRMMKFFEPNARVCNVCKKTTNRKSGRKSHLGKTYEITPEEFEALLEASKGVCWICGGSRPYNLHVDHSHIHEKLYGVRKSIRGLLCKRCNKLLRDVGDNLDLLKAAVHYLMTGRIRAQEVLDPDKRIN